MRGVLRQSGSRSEPALTVRSVRDSGEGRIVTVTTILLIIGHVTSGGRHLSINEKATTDPYFRDGKQESTSLTFHKPAQYAIAE